MDSGPPAWSGCLAAALLTVAVILFIVGLLGKALS